MTTLTQYLDEVQARAESAIRGEFELHEFALKSRTDIPRLVGMLRTATEALEKITNGRFHIGNDENGNMFGPPDSVMCRRIVSEALATLERMAGEGG